MNKSVVSGCGVRVWKMALRWKVARGALHLESGPRWLLLMYSSQPVASQVWPRFHSADSHPKWRPILRCNIAFSCSENDRKEAHGRGTHSDMLNALPETIIQSWRSNTCVAWTMRQRERSRERGQGDFISGRSTGQGELSVTLWNKSSREDYHIDCVLVHYAAQTQLKWLKLSENCQETLAIWLPSFSCHIQRKMCERDHVVRDAPSSCF